jgi:tetratricopeptide (TPR) repeat protein
LSESAALDRAGRSTEALAAADRALADAERGSYAPSVAEAALQRGRVLVTRHELRPAVASLLRARTIALEQRMFPVAVEAAARQLFSEGTVDARIALLERDAAMFLPLSAGLVGDHFARPLLLNNIGTLYMAAGDRDAATRYFQDAARALAGVAEPDLELTCIDKNLAMVTRDYKAREELARGVWQRLRAQLGDAHLSTIDAADSYARFVTEPARALVLLGPVCDSYDTFHPSLIELRVYCRSYRAFLAGEAGQREQQLASYDGIVELARGSTDEDVVARSALAVGSAKLLRGDPRGAIAAWQPVATEDARDRNWWIRLRAAHAEVGLGQAEHALGHNAAAMPHFATAMATYREASASNEETEHRFRLAMAERLMREVGGAPKIGNKSGAGVTKLP